MIGVIFRNEISEFGSGKLNKSAFMLPQFKVKSFLFLSLFSTPFPHFFPLKKEQLFVFEHQTLAYFQASSLLNSLSASLVAKPCSSDLFRASEGWPPLIMCIGMAAPCAWVS